MVGDHKLAAIDLIRVGAIVKCGVHAGKALVATHVGNDHTIVLNAIRRGALNHQAGLVAAVLQVLALAIHGVTAAPSWDCSANCGLVPPEPFGRLKYSGAPALREPTTAQPIMI